MFLGLSTFLLTDGVKFDFDRCMPMGLFGRDEPSPIDVKLLVDVADFNL